MMHRPTLLAVAGLALATSFASAEPPDELDRAPSIPPEVAVRMKAAAAAAAAGPNASGLPAFDTVAKDYQKVISTADGKASLYTVWTRKKDAQMLIELPRSFEKQRVFIAYTIAGGIPTAGVQVGDMYAYWKRYDKRIALIEPNFAVRTTGDLESRKGRDRVFTDRVILDVPIVAMGKGGGPVIDGDALLIGQSSSFFGGRTAGARSRLAQISKSKAFPKNVELAFKMPLSTGRFATLHYSISALPDQTGYRSRDADARIGYFTTTHMDIGKPGADTPWKRYINRWKLEKADASLRMSPPKESIIFYLEHTIPVRYRRWVRDGVLEWNNAFEKVGIVNAIEVYQQDAKTGAHMEKDPEDARYNFVLWTNASMGYAIGPSRVDPRTGQILDADIVMDEGFITSWSNAWKRLIPDQAVSAFGPQTLAWLERHPDWDPRVRLAEPARRDAVIRELQLRQADRRVGLHAAERVDPTLLGDEAYDGLRGRISQVSGACMNMQARSLDMALFRLDPNIFIEFARGDDGEEDEGEDEGEGEGEKPEEAVMLDGVPEWFIGPLLKDVVMHECGHTLGLRHNFKASSAYGLDEINCEASCGQAITGSVMDYNPLNINVDDGPSQGEYAMVTLGPYDYWAIEFGYSSEPQSKACLARVAEPELAYATDEDTWGPDPLARRFDLGRNSLDYSESQLRLVEALRAKLLERMVDEGESWSKARQAYEVLLGRHIGAVAISANWIGGSHVNRDRKGDPGDREPIENISADEQRRALAIVIASTLRDGAFGLSPELLRKMTIDKWWDEGDEYSIFEDPTWPVHDRVAGIQASAVTMILNPTTLGRVYDNEFRIDANEDALTIPEVLIAVVDEVFSELDAMPSRSCTAREPFVTSLRRNLQRETLDRLIDLTISADMGAASTPVSNLCLAHLRGLESRIDRVLELGDDALDPYTHAHLSEARIRIAKALDAQYIYNADAMGGGGGIPFFLMEPTDGS